MEEKQVKKLKIKWVIKRNTPQIIETRLSYEDIDKKTSKWLIRWNSKIKRSEIENIVWKSERMELSIIDSVEWNKVVKLVYWDKEFYWDYAIFKILSKVKSFKSLASRMKNFTDEFYKNKNSV